MTLDLDLMNSIVIDDSAGEHEVLVDVACFVD